MTPNRLMPLVYDELRTLARAYLRGATPDYMLQPTVLVHEAYLKLVNQGQADWKGRTHFLAVGARAMRQILVDYARNGKRKKRWGGCIRMDFSEGQMFSMERPESILALDERHQIWPPKTPKKHTLLSFVFSGA